MYGSIDFIHILFYNICMEYNYRYTNTTVSLTNYHFVFCPRYKGKDIKREYYIRKRGEYYDKLYC